jgi:hypothetical protein
MFSPRRPQGKRQLCWILRDGLADVFNHHHDAPQKTCSYTEEANANRLVSIFLQSSLFGWLRPARAFGARDYLSELASPSPIDAGGRQARCQAAKSNRAIAAATQPASGYNPPVSEPTMSTGSGERNNPRRFETTSREN